MKKIIMVLMLLALSVATFSCGGGSGSSSSPKGENPGLPSVVQLRSSHDVAQTNATVYLHARILDGNGVPVKNERVTFTNLSEPFGVIKTVLKVLGLRKPIGVLSAPVVKTNNLGIATVKLTSTTSGFATIQAEVNGGAGQVRDKRTIFFGVISGPVATPEPTLDLSVDDGNGAFDQNDDFNLFKGGSAADNQRTIRAIVLNASGVPQQGVTVTFGSDSPDEVTFTPELQTAITNANGEAFVLVTVNPSILTNLQRVLNITAQATVDGTSLADVVSLFLQPVTVTSVTVAANPDRVAPNGTSTIAASVKMLQSLPVPDGSSVSFETTCGSITPFGLTTDGVATATFTAPSVPPAGPCTVTASIGGVSGTANITVTTTLTVQPSSQTLNGITGGTATYTIFGGAAPYVVFSNDTAFPAVVAENIFTVNVSPNSTPKTITYTVRDSLGVSVTASLVIAGGTALAVLPSAVTVDSTAPEDTITFTIFGGVAPYSVFSNNPASFPPSTPTVAASGGTFTVVVPAGAASQSVLMTIRDSGNPAATVTANITITAIAPQPLRVIPTTRTIGNPVVGNTAGFTVTGGQAPYKAFSNNPLLVTVPEDAAGNTVTATVAGVPATDTTVTITIFDSLGTSVNASLILDIAPVLPMSVIPTTQTLSNPSIGNTAQYQVLGGTGGYIVFSNNPTLVTATVAGNVVTATVQSIPSTDTTVTLTIYDSAGSSVNASLVLDILPVVSLVVIPATQTIANPIVGNTAQYQVTGGTGGYAAFSNNPALATAAVAGNVVIATVHSVPSTDTTVTFTIYDSTANTISATLTLDVAPAQPLTVLPNARTISGETGGARTFTIFGGVPGYTVTSSNPSIAFDSGIGDGDWSVANSGGSITVNVPANTPASSVTLTVRDLAGTSTTATLTITAGPTLTVQPGSQIINSSTGGAATYTIFGGVPGYTVASSNPAIAYDSAPGDGNWTVGASGGTFTVNVAPFSPSGAITLSIRDSAGTAVSATLTIAAPTPTLSITPTTFTIGLAAPPTVDILYFASGGVAPYQVFFTLPVFVDLTSPTQNADIVGTAGDNNQEFIVTYANSGLTGTFQLIVVDSLGTVVTSTITISP